jgi:AmmeMemoRadiSam system protein B
MLPESTPMIRPSAIAGRWYPGNPATLRRDIEGYFAATPKAVLPGRILGLIAPHAGYGYSGPTAARAFAQVRGADFVRVVLLGPLHRPISGSPVGAFMVPTESAYRTPLGVVPLDGEFIARLASSPGISLTRVEGDEEHALEIELPFLQVALGSFSLVPVMMGEHIGSSRATEQVAALARALVELIDEPVADRTSTDRTAAARTLLVCSTDLSHMENYADVVATDRGLVEMVAAFDVDRLRTALKAQTVQACGAVALLAVLEAAKLLGARGAQVLQYTNSGEVTGDKRPGTYTVGYLAAAVYGD